MSMGNEAIAGEPPPEPFETDGQGAGFDAVDRALMERSPGIVLEDFVCQTDAANNLRLRQELAAIAILDDREHYTHDGAPDMVQWLCMKRNWSRATALRRLKAAHALEDLPHIARGFSSGRISEDQLHELVRFATPETDAKIAADAPGWSYQETVKRARYALGLGNKEAQQDFEARRLSFRSACGDRMVRLSGLLPAADGALVQHALSEVARQAPPEPMDQDRHRDWTERLADALVQVCEERTASDPTPDRATTTVFCSSEAIVDEAGVGETEQGGLVPSTTLRRLLCDARLHVLLESSDGKLISLGQTVRTLPRRLRRYLRSRQGHCAFPGCDHTSRLTPHHIDHFAHQGPTDEDNLVLLCGFHHRLVHEGGFRVTGKPPPFGELSFFRPDGTPLRHCPSPVRPEVAGKFRLAGPSP